MQVKDVLSKDNTEKDYYERLGCSQSSNKDQITTEYRVRVRDFHPDKQGPSPDPASSDEFIRLTRAYDVLTDDELRKKYDKYLASGLNIPFDAWCHLNEHKRVMHWAVPRQQPTLEHG